MLNIPEAKYHGKVKMEYSRAYTLKTNFFSRPIQLSKMFEGNVRE